jgi:hypothetical protein
MIAPQPIIKPVAVSANYQAVPGDVVLGTGGAGGITVTLPPVAQGGPVIVRQVDAGAGHVTIVTADGSKIDGITGTTGVTTAAQHGGFQLATDGANWFVIGL